MNNEYYFKIVEQTLNLFPSEFSKNYYLNKSDAIIQIFDEEIKGITGIYVHDENIIKTSEGSLIHELFHMAFRDRRKMLKKISNDEEIYYDNGVSLKKEVNGITKIYNRGLTEGFAEYLNRKCNGKHGQMCNYFFVDLLISIYGEDILKYPLLNDPRGFLLDERFNDITAFSVALDQLDDAESSIMLLENFGNILKDMVEKKEYIENIIKLIENVVLNTELSVKACFNQIIREYMSCEKPGINKENFLNKINSFLNDPDYKHIFVFDSQENNLKNEIIIIIENFKNTITNKKTF